MTTRPCKSSFLAPAPTPTLTGSEERRCLLRAAPSSLPPPFPRSPGRAIGRELAWGGGGAGLDAFVCHGGGRRKGRGESGSARERARCEREGRAGGGSFYLGRARLLAARLPGPRVTWGGGQVRTHWPPRRTARRARPQAAEPSGGSVRPPTRSLCPARPALAEPHGHSAGLRGRGSQSGSLPRAHGAAAAPWAHHGGNACRVPARRPPPEPKCRLSVVLSQPPGPCPAPARPRVPSGRSCLWRSPPPWIMHRNFRKWIFYVFLCFGVLYVKLG